MAATHTITVVFEGDDGSRDLDANSLAEARTKAKDAGEKGFWFRDASGAEIFYPARRIKEIWVRPKA
jgi:hypothetical protein